MSSFHNNTLVYFKFNLEFNLNYLIFRIINLLSFESLLGISKSKVGRSLLSFNVIFSVLLSVDKINESSDSLGNRVTS